MNSTEDITGLILAGGAGRRVDGRDKGLIEWRGRPLVAHVTQRLRPQVGQLLISCNRNFRCYQKFAPTTGDSRSNFQGPLAGLEAALPMVDTNFLVVVACDTPLLPADLVLRLVAKLQVTGIDIAYVHDGNREQYLCAAMTRSCMSSITGFLDEGHRAVRLWFSQQKSVSVDFSDNSAAFDNYNYA